LTVVSVYMAQRIHSSQIPTQNKTFQTVSITYAPRLLRPELGARWSCL
jgi:hypothetical protein